MSRRTITIDPALHSIINVVRGIFLMVGQDYNYTEVVNNAIFYGICYWLGISHDKAVELASQVLTKDLKLEGMRDEERDHILQGLAKIGPFTELKSLTEAMK